MKTIILWALAGIMSIPAHARTNAKAEELDTASTKRIALDEVVVVGFKENKNEDLSLPASKLKGSFLVSNQITSIREISGMVPNLFFPDYGSRKNTPIYIRGIGSKTNAPSVGFYVDGMPVFDRSSFDFELSDISNIEVLRGPQGTLYGRNAIGGLINVYTYSPLEYQNTRIRVDYSSRNEIKATASTSMKINDNMGLTAMGAYHHNDGFFKNITTNKKADKMNNGSGRVSFVWKFAPKWTARIMSSLDYLDQGGYPYGAYDYDTKEMSPIDYELFSFYRRTSIMSGLNLNYEGNKFQINSQSSFQFQQDKQLIDQDFTASPLYKMDNRQRQNLWSQEITIKSVGDNRYKWLTGVFAFSNRVNNNSDIDYMTKEYSLPKYYHNPTTGIALYHQSTLDITDNLSATVGLRYDYESNKQDYKAYKSLYNNNQIEQTANQSSSLYFNQLTPKFSLLYTLKNESALFATVSRGYKTGGFNVTFRDESEKAFNPEHNWNYEVGTKLNFFDNKLHTELTLFYIDWKNQQVTQTVPGFGNIISNAGHSTSKGIEFSISSRPTKGLNVSLDYGYTYAKFLSYKKSETVDYKGNLLPMLPQHTLSAHADYTIFSNGSLFDRLVFSGTLTGNGPIYWTEDNSTRQNFYCLLNVKVAATKGIFTWELWSRNLTNTTYNSYYFVSQKGFAQQGRPISVGTSLIVNI